MLHYEVAPEKLQPFVPFDLDVRDGKAYVSLVAFTMHGLRPRRGGWLAALPFKPVATHEFLNVRTYVKHGGESGIFFLAEWLPNLLSVAMGRPVFGLPYRWGKLEYLHEHERGMLYGSVQARRGRGALRYRARVGRDFAPCASGSLTEFLMERYIAFTDWRGWKRRFRVWHEPWPQCAVEEEVLDDSLLALTGSWVQHARFIGANYSPGVRDVWMSRPGNASAESRTPNGGTMNTMNARSDKGACGALPTPEEWRVLRRIKTSTRLSIGLVWVWEGLMPKMLFPSATQFAMVKRSGWWWGSPEQTLWWLGAAMVLAGVAIMSGLWERAAALVSTLAVLVLIVLVISSNPEALHDPFGGLVKDACLFTCAAMVWWWPDGKMGRRKVES